MNLPNKITISRIILTVVFLFLLFVPGAAAKTIALFIFLLAAFTDYLDGWIAKKNNIVSDFGRIMDPVADKVLTLSAFAVFCYMGIVPDKIVVVIFIREIMVTGFRLKALLSGKVLSAASAGKRKTVSQMVSIFVILVFIVLREGGSGMFGFWTPDAEYYFGQGIIIMMIVTAVLTVASGVSYFWENREHLPWLSGAKNRYRVK